MCPGVGPVLQDTGPARHLATEGGILKALLYVHRDLSDMWWIYRFDVSQSYRRSIVFGVLSSVPRHPLRVFHADTDRFSFGVSTIETAHTISYLHAALVGTVVHTHKPTAIPTLPRD